MLKSPQRPPLHICMESSSKTLIHTLLFSHICRLLAKLKALVLELCQEARLLRLRDPASDLARRKKKMNKYRRKILFGSFRLHYNWCSASSHVLPINCGYSSPSSGAHAYYDSTWGSAFSVGGPDDGATRLSTYLEWLEEKGKDKGGDGDADGEEMHEIDKLADMFIANCHEKFRLEKIESYRRYQEMLARSV